MLSEAQTMELGQAQFVKLRGGGAKVVAVHGRRGC